MNKKIKNRRHKSLKHSGGGRIGKPGESSVKYLIVGAGPAAIAAIEAIRKRDKRGAITIVSSEKEVFYSRPLISYLLADDIGEENLFYRGEDFISANAPLRIIAGAPASSINPRDKTAAIAYGRVLKWEKLIIASGGVPIVPPAILGAKNLRTFTTIEDARRLDADIKSGAKRAVVVGGGFIGLKCAEALVKRGVSVTLVELAMHVLPSLLDDVSAGIFQKNLERHGVSVRTLSSVEKIYDGGKKLKLSGGEVIETDIIISAVGVRPNVSFLEGSLIRMGKGVIVGDDMRSSADGVFAAGDAADVPEFFSGARRAVPIWPVARQTGAIAGENAAGGAARAAGALTMNSIEVFGLAVISAGSVNPSPDSGTAFLDGAAVETADGLADLPDGTPRYKKLVFDGGGRLAGFIMLGDVERAGIYTELIKNRASVAAFKRDLAGDSFGFICVGEENWKKRIMPLEV
ncbi:MAG: FAD-dependent oxidoreductase [Endomicrobiia bacterium]|nr:FAD-dependent oxidoreductase [Endomicrobiia bacterium]